MAVSAPAGPWNIFVVGLDDFHLAQLQQLPGSGRYAFHSLFTREELKCGERFPVREILEDGPRRLKEFAGRVHAVVGYWDFPVSTVLPLLRGPLGLPGPSLEAVLRCEHKYWSRLEQREAVPELTPEFRAFDPFDEGSIAAIDLPYPYWVKPVKASGSRLAYKIRGAADLRRAVASIRQGIHRFADPFQYVLDRIDLPGPVARVTGRWCIAESLMHGRQCTVEGYVHAGRAEASAVMDSVRGPNRCSFQRYQYPSRLPLRIQEQVRSAALRFVRAIGYDNGTFNMEFFWDPVGDRVWVLEVNPRLSQSHSDITEKVDGTPNLERMVEVAVGRRPRRHAGPGPYRCAAKFFVRRYEDARVLRTPTAADIRRLEQRFPGLEVAVIARRGSRLSELPRTDSYSYELAVLYIGAMSERELLSRYEQCLRELPFETDADRRAAAAP